MITSTSNPDRERDRPPATVFGLLAQATEALGKGNFSKALADLLCQASGHRYAALMLFSGPDAPVPLFTNHTSNGTRRFITPYVSRRAVYEADPLLIRFRTCDSEAVHDLADVCEPDFHRSHYYVDFYQKLQLEDETGLAVRLNERDLLFVSLGTWSGGRASRNSWLGALMPCIGALCRQHWQQSRTTGQRSVDDIGATLSQRERQMFDAVMAGDSTKEYARKTGISPETAKIYRRRMLRKLDAGSTRELYAKMLRGAA